MSDATRAETWLPTCGIPGYEASDHGGVRITAARGTLRAGALKAQKVNASGYHRVSLTAHGRAFTRVVHLLVAEAFVGPSPSRDHQVNHKNGVKSDNQASNLEWTSPLENIAHARATGLVAPSRARGRVLTALAVRVIRRCRGVVTQRFLAEAFDVAPVTIGHIHAGRRWGRIA